VKLPNFEGRGFYKGEPRSPLYNKFLGEEVGPGGSTGSPLPDGVVVGGVGGRGVNGGIYKGVVSPLIPLYYCLRL